MNNRPDRWKVRQRRAVELSHKHSAAASALQLYAATLDFQSQLALRWNTRLDPDVPLREQIESVALCSEMASLLSIAEALGPPHLRREAQRVRELGEDSWRQILNAALAGHSELAASEDFFARGCLQPMAENLQLQTSRDANYIGSTCPACDGLPQAAVLRPEGEGASRCLVCSFCLCEWPFRRIVCPWCAEEDKEKLPRYSNEQWPHVHVEACDTCQHYLKAIDLSVDGLAVPLVDEAALAVLDVWATDRGYTKIIRNLIGF